MRRCREYPSAAHSRGPGTAGGTAPDLGPTIGGIGGTGGAGGDGGNGGDGLLFGGSGGAAGDGTVADGTPGASGTGILDGVPLPNAAESVVAAIPTLEIVRRRLENQRFAVAA